MLGDDALAVLKDIKRWMKLYDEKLNRLDVARCLAEASLIKGDLLEILAAWRVEDEEDKIKAKIVLACRMYTMHQSSVLTCVSRIARPIDMASRKGGNADHSQLPPTSTVLATRTDILQEGNS